MIRPVMRRAASSLRGARESEHDEHKIGCKTNAIALLPFGLEAIAHREKTSYCPSSWSAVERIRQTAVL